MQWGGYVLPPPRPGPPPAGTRRYTADNTLLPTQVFRQSGEPYTKTLHRGGIFDFETEFPTGDSDLRLDGDVCFLSFTPEMRQLEIALERAVLVQVGGTRPQVMNDEIRQVLLRRRDIHFDSASVVRHFPSDFLVIFNNLSIKERVIRGGDIRVGSLHFIIRPWNRQSQASSRAMNYRCAISLVGLPGHAWTWNNVAMLPSSSCWIEPVHPDLASRTDLRAYKVIAWTGNPYSIPKYRVASFTVPDGHINNEVPDPEVAAVTLRRGQPLARLPLQQALALPPLRP